MAIEYKLPYTAFEISDKLRTVDEVKTALENDYCTRDEVNTTFEKITDIIEEVNNSANNANTSLNYKADLVDGKIPVEQLPDDIGGGLTEVAWEDIKNKPFEEISRGEKITWDGNTDGLTTISLEMPDMGATFVCCKLSDMILTKEQAMGKNFEAYADGNTMSLSVDMVGGATPNCSFYMTNSDFGMPVIWMCSHADDTVVYEGDVNFSLTFPETGLWFFAMIMEGSIYSRAVSFTIPDVIKTLDIKYLPDNMALGYETKAFEDIIWDGNTDGLPMVSVNADVDGTPMTLTLYKVSDCVIPMTSIDESELTIFLEGEENSIDKYEDEMYPCHSNGSYLDSEYVSFFCITENNTTVDMSPMVPDLMVEFPEAGIWFLVMETGGMEIQRPTALRAPINITKIDVKYLPTDEPYGVATLDYAGKIPSDKVWASSAVNEYDSSPVSSSAVYNELQNKQDKLTIESSVSSSSNNPVSSSAVYKAIENKKITVDTWVDSLSGNAVSGSAVYWAIQNNKTTVDSTVQSGSNNAVSGNAVYNAIQKGSVPVTTSDNGKFMRVVDGAWAAVAIPNAEDGEF
jgi:hypothetical protein